LAAQAGDPAVEPGSTASDAAPAPRSWDAALGFITSYAPEYAGSNRWVLGVKPGGWVRWGRLSIATRSTFVVRSGEPLAGSGLRLDLSPGQRLRVGLSLRQDSGRQESDSADLRGLGDVRRTLRLRLAASVPMDGWRLGGSVTADALGRGGGELAEVAFSRGVPLAPRLNASASATLSYGSARYMQAYYGITEEQSARSGYPVYVPGAGLRDIALALGLRHQLEGPWVVFAGISASRLVDKAAGSPLVRERDSWALSAGLAYRF
jgi:outer membrane scaffolding protein for murein synthesis (MipA/OmpV family)